MGLFGKNKDDDTPTMSGGGMDMTPMVTMIAAAPEAQRREMLTDRLAVFASQDEESRARGMAAMLTAALGLPDDDYATVAASRLAVMLEMAPEDRAALMATHAATVKGLEDEALRQKEMRTTKQVVSQLPDEQREMVMGKMRELGMMP
ncbi:MAG: hypothetical protein BMS9Abin07_1623 [Acidimicrobiia bacterium]|nr:MAG: hypothetical protein BMS9Abin07_1623 [Acidimicrobiia bacterium]